MRVNDMLSYVRTDQTCYVLRRRTQPPVGPPAIARERGALATPNILG